MEIASFLDILDFSAHENDSYKSDDILVRVQRMEDRARIDKLLQEIHKCVENLRNDVNKLVFVGKEGKKKLRVFARFLWLVRKSNLQERARRLDLLRTRFLVIYFELMANKIFSEYCSSPKLIDHEKVNESISPIPQSSSLLQNKTKVQNLITLQTSPGPYSLNNQKHGWTDVLAELQRSPLMQKRHNLNDHGLAQAPT